MAQGCTVIQHHSGYNLTSVGLAVSDAVCLRDPNFSESTVGISELAGVCVLRCELLKPFWREAQDEQSLR